MLDVVVDDCVTEDALKLIYIELTIVVLIASFHYTLYVVFNFGGRDLTCQLRLHKALDLFSGKFASAANVGCFE